MVQSQAKYGKLFLNLAAAALIAAASAGVARAADASGAEVTVSTHGLDLRDPGADAVLRHRVLHAARRLCVKSVAPATVMSEAFESCVSDAVQGATPAVQSLVDTARGQDHYVAAVTPRG
jgi:UrcA family protein